MKGEAAYNHMNIWIKFDWFDLGHPTIINFNVVHVWGYVLVSLTANTNFITFKGGWEPFRRWSFVRRKSASCWWPTWKREGDRSKEDETWMWQAIRQIPELCRVSCPVARKDGISWGKSYDVNYWDNVKWIPNLLGIPRNSQLFPVVKISCLPNNLESLWNS